jgi:hypothetical protein
MARGSDYCGKEFGSFRIGDMAGHGFEAEVYKCTHLPTGIVFILRLDIGDESLWSGAALLPPVNATIEVPNAKGAWMISKSCTESSLSLRCVDIFGVLENRYLTPVTAPLRLRDAYDIADVLGLPPLSSEHHFTLMDSFGLYSDLICTMCCQALYQELDDTTWGERWSCLVGGRFLKTIVPDFLRSIGANEQQQQKAEMRILRNETALELADNIVLRLWWALRCHRITLAQFAATLMCPYFRLNISKVEFCQLVTGLNNLRSQGNYVSDSLQGSRQFLDQVVRILASESPKRTVAPELFEIRDEQPDLSQFTLFLQQHA